MKEPAGPITTRQFVMTLSTFVVTVAIAYAVIETLRFALDLPAPVTPVVVVLALAVLIAQLRRGALVRRN